MPLYRRLPKRGFKSLFKKNIAIVNLSLLEKIYEKKILNTENSVDLKILKENKIIAKHFDKLKILGSGEIKNKFNITTNFISKQAQSKIEKVGGKLTIIKKKI